MYFGLTILLLSAFPIGVARQGEIPTKKVDVNRKCFQGWRCLLPLKYFTLLFHRKKCKVTSDSIYLQVTLHFSLQWWKKDSFKDSCFLRIKCFSCSIFKTLLQLLLEDIFEPVFTSQCVLNAGIEYRRGKCLRKNSPSLLLGAATFLAK